jgi:hypothetical protein
VKNKTKQYKLNNSGRRGYNRFLKSVKRKDKIYDPNQGRKVGIKQDNVYKKNTCIIDEYNLSETLKFLFLNKNNFSSHQPSIPKNGVLYVPKIFSLIEYPEESFKFLKDLLYTLRYPKNRKIKISYKYCIRIDLDAAVCNDIILLEYINAFKYCNEQKIALETYSIDAIELEDENVKKFLFATGTHKIIKNINFNFPNILTYDLVIGDKKRGIAYKEVESTKLVQHIEKCLKKMNKKLTSDARESFGEIIGEVMANAEEHNITDFHYSIGHFEETEDSEVHIGMFQLVIFNFGESIYERFKNPSACKNKEILVDMNSLAEKYTKRGFFGFLNGNRFEEETLWTLYSLQDGVSSVDKNRGNGTIKFIDSFLELGDSNLDKTSKLNLMSGNTTIKFDGTYKTIVKLNNLGEDFKIIPFNNVGSLDEKPDQKFVTFVNNFFPGTMIYANICIKESDIIKNEND